MSFITYILYMFVTYYSQLWWLPMIDMISHNKMQFHILYIMSDTRLFTIVIMIYSKHLKVPWSQNNIYLKIFLLYYSSHVYVYARLRTAMCPHLSAVSQRALQVRTRTKNVRRIVSEENATGIAAASQVAHSREAQETRDHDRAWHVQSHGRGLCG